MTQDTRNEAQAKHSPTPWRCGGPVSREALLKHLNVDAPNGITEEVWEIGADSPDWIDRVPPGIAVVNHLPGLGMDAEANAALIVRAVNAHAGLVAALERLEEALRRIAGSAREDGDGSTRPLSRELQKIARAALAAAKGGDDA